MARVVKCIKPAAGLEVGKLYEVSCDAYDLVHVGGEHDGHSRDCFEYVRAVYHPREGKWCEIISGGHGTCVTLKSGCSEIFLNHCEGYNVSELPTETPEQHPLTKYTRKSTIGIRPDVMSKYTIGIPFDTLSELAQLELGSNKVTVDDNGDVEYRNGLKAVSRTMGSTRQGVEKYQNEAIKHVLQNRLDGVKHDGDKLKPTLLLDDMPLAIQEMLKVLKHGADKYAEGNWLKVNDGVNRYRNACDRHRLQSSIEEYDSESGFLHLAHEAVNAVMLLELVLRSKEVK